MYKIAKRSRRPATRFARIFLFLALLFAFSLGVRESVLNPMGFADALAYMANAEIKAETGDRSASVSFLASDEDRKVYVIARVIPSESRSWFDAELLEDGERRRQIRTTIGHVRENKDYDLIYVGTIDAGDSPTFRVQVVRDSEFNPHGMNASVNIWAIAAE